MVSNSPKERLFYLCRQVWSESIFVNSVNYVTYINFNYVTYLYYTFNSSMYIIILAFIFIYFNTIFLLIFTRIYLLFTFLLLYSANIYVKQWQCDNLQWVTKYLGLTLVFVWNGTQREKSNFCFSSFLLVLAKLSFWRGHWALGYQSRGFRHFPGIF